VKKLIEALTQEKWQYIDSVQWHIYKDPEATENFEVIMSNKPTWEDVDDKSIIYTKTTS